MTTSALMPLGKVLTRAMIVIAIISSPANAVDIIVAANATSDGNGLSWTSPRRYVLDAIAQAEVGDTILVAQGTYFTNEANDATLPTNLRASSFLAKEGVSLLGGFIGPNSLSIPPGTRNIALYETILSGDINVGSTSTNDAYHVVLAVNIAPLNEQTPVPKTILSGFTITGGNSSGQPNASSCGTTIVAGGAGMDCRSVSDRLEIRDCLFTGNTANFGGGMRIACGNPIVVNCVFDDNTALTNGGGMYGYLDSSPRVDNCIFRNNSSGHMGGGFGFQAGGNPTLTNCVFAHNHADDFGGGIRSGFDVGCRVVNSTFFENNAGCGGGMSTGRDSEDNPDRDVTLQNCIFWGNTVTSPSTACESSGQGSQISMYGPTGGTILRTLKVEYCDVEGGEAEVFVQTGMPLTWGDGNMDEDPSFFNDADVDGADDLLGTSDDGLMLQYDSPCLNAGEAAALPADTADVDDDLTVAETIPVDVARTVRQVNLPDCVDIGAYENQQESCPADIGGGTNGAPDGVVDGADLGILLARWDEPGGIADLSPSPCGDGIVDGADLGLLLEAWGNCPGESLMSGPSEVESLLDNLGLESIDELVEFLTGLEFGTMQTLLEVWLG